jgi:hypothetical protein
MLTSENGIRESHSGQKYERIDQSLFNSADGLALEEILSGGDKQGKRFPPRSYGAYPDVASERDGHAGPGGSSGKRGDGRLADRVHARQ